MARRCWKHSRQKTGRPWVGRKGTVVSLPHWEQLVLVSARIEEPPPVAPLSLRLALQALQRLGSFLKPLSAKNICSPAVKTNSAPHSAHFRTLSWYSIRCSLAPGRRRGRQSSRTNRYFLGWPGYPGCRGRVPLADWLEAAGKNPRVSA